MTETAARSPSVARPAEMTEAGAPSSVATDGQLIAMLGERARGEGLQLIGEGGLLGRLTTRVLESALAGEVSGHLGYGRRDPAGEDSGNSRTGTAPRPC